MSEEKKICGFDKAGEGEAADHCELPSRGDKSGYCIFHAPVEEKTPDEFWKELRIYISRIENQEEEISYLENDIEFDFRGFVFPATGDFFEDNEFEYPVNFVKAKFTGIAIFYSTHFNAAVKFDFAKFENEVYFSDTEFAGGVQFAKTNFEKKTEFINVNFRKMAGFIQTEFGGDVLFHTAEFGESIWFDNTKYGGIAHFTECKFGGYAPFKDAVFEGQVVFHEVIFKDGLDMSSVTFGDIAVFKEVESRGEMKFDYSSFEKGAFLENIVTTGNNSNNEKAEILPRVTFTNIWVGENGDLVFRSNDLGEWAFAETNKLDRAEFIDISWQGSGDIKRNHTGDEILAKKGYITYEIAAAVYRQLRKNYESRLAYAEAGDFHIGEMEMLLAGKVLGKPKLFFLKWYKRISNFGESVGRPLWWFAGIWAAFLFIWLVLPARHEFAGVFNILKLNFDWPREWLSKTRFPDITEFGWYVWRKFWFTASNFITFPKPEGTYFERFLGGFQRFLGVTIVTFFILALRRAFRR